MIQSLNLQTWDIDLIQDWCWANVYDVVPTSILNRPSAVCWCNQRLGPVATVRINVVTPHHKTGICWTFVKFTYYYDSAADQAALVTIPRLHGDLLHNNKMDGPEDRGLPGVTPPPPRLIQSGAHQGYGSGDTGIGGGPVDSGIEDKGHRQGHQDGPEVGFIPSLSHDLYTSLRLRSPTL